MTLREEKLKEYKDALYELQLKAYADGKVKSCVSPELWRVYNPESKTGCQIMKSYTKEEFVKIALHARRKDDICRAHPTEWHQIYQSYFRIMFGTLDKAREYANSRFRDEKSKSRASKDWSEKVSAEGFLEYCRARGREPEAELAAFMVSLCEEIKSAGKGRLPAAPPKSIQAMINEVCSGWVKAYRKCGIPVAKTGRAKSTGWDLRKKQKAVRDAGK